MMIHKNKHPHINRFIALLIPLCITLSILTPLVFTPLFSAAQTKKPDKTAPPEYYKIKSQKIQLESHEAIKILKNNPSPTYILSQLENKSWRIRCAAFEMLSREKTTNEDIAADLLLQKLLTEQDERVLRSISLALKPFESPQTIQRLKNLAETNPNNNSVQNAIITTLGSYSTPEAADTLIEFLQNDKSTYELKYQTLNAIAKNKNPKTVLPLCNELKKLLPKTKKFNENYYPFQLSERIIEILGIIRDPLAKPTLIQALNDAGDPFLGKIIETLCALNQPDVVKPILNTLKNTDIIPWENLPQIISTIRDPRLVDEVISFLLSSIAKNDPRSSNLSAFILGELNNTKAVPALLYALKYQNNHKDQLPHVKITLLQALGKLPDPTSIETMTEILKNSDIQEKKLAASILFDIETPEALQHLLPHLKDKLLYKELEDHLHTRQTPYAADLLMKTASSQIGLIQDAAFKLLSNTLTPKVRKFFIRCLTSMDFRLRQQAIAHISLSRFPQARKYVAVNLNHPSEKLRLNAASALLEIRAPEAIDTLIQLMNSSKPEVRADAIYRLRNTVNPRIIEPLLQKLKDKFYYTRLNAIYVLLIQKNNRIIDPVISTLKRSNIKNPFIISQFSCFKNRNAVNYLIEYLEQPDSKIKKAALSALMKIGDSAAITPIVNCLENDHDNQIRAHAVHTLQAFKDKHAVAAAVKALNDPHPLVCAEAARTLSKIGGPQTVRHLITAFLNKKSFKKTNNHTNRKLNDSFAEKNHGTINTLPISNDDQFAIINALGKIKSPEALPLLLSIIQAKTPANSVSIMEQPAYEAIKEIAGVPLAFYLKYLSKENNTQFTSLTLPTILKDFQNIDKYDLFNSALDSEKTYFSYELYEYLNTLIRDQSPKQRFDHLFKLEQSPFLAPLIISLKYNDPIKREEASFMLEEISSEALTHIYLTALKNENEEQIRSALFFILGKSGNSDAIDPLIETIKNEPPANPEIIIALGQLKAKASVPYLIRELQSPLPVNRYAAAEALGNIKSRKAVGPLIKALNDKDFKVKRIIIYSLGKIKDPRATSYIIRYLTHPNDPIRKTAAMSLGEIQDEQAVKPLVNTLYDINPAVRKCAADSLGQITGQSFGTNTERWEEWVNSLQRKGGALFIAMMVFFLLLTAAFVYFATRKLPNTK